MFKEFKKFALKGNMVDLAVGIIIGTAFGTMVKSMVDDVLMPPLGMALGGVDFGDKKLVLKDAILEGTKVKVPEVAIKYGSFINAVIAFLIMAFALFILVKAMNKLMAKEEAAPAAPPKSEVLLEEIRDLLKQQRA
ncbi:MAG: large-conductance mechanosensitive channel protein MscL [Planctomycetota bacterium]